MLLSSPMPIPTIKPFAHKGRVLHTLNAIRSGNPMPTARGSSSLLLRFVVMKSAEANEPCDFAGLEESC